MDTPSDISFALLLMRCSLGLMLAAHGYKKAFAGGKLAGTARWFDSIGMRPGKLHAFLAAYTEMAGGIALAIGLFQPLAAASIVGVMIVAGWTSHRKNGFFILKDGWEYVFIIGVVATTLAMLGPGEWSLDRAIGIDDDLDGWAGLAIAAGVGGTAGIGSLLAFFRPNAESPSA